MLSEAVVHVSPVVASGRIPGESGLIASGQLGNKDEQEDQAPIVPCKASSPYPNFFPLGSPPKVPVTVH